MSETAANASSGTSRLFGSAVESVRKSWNEASVPRRRVITSGMRSDHYSSLGSARTVRRTVMDRHDDRTVTSYSTQLPHRSVLLDEYGPVRPRRSSLRPLSAVPYQHSKTSSTAEEWQHDLFDGHVANHPGSEVFVRSLPSGITKEQLERLFGKVGVVVALKLDQGPLPTAKVSFLKKHSAADAVKMYSGYKLHGSVVKVCIYEKPSSAQPNVTDDESFFLPNALQTSPGSYQKPHRRVPLRRRSAVNPTSLLRSDAPQMSVFDRLC